MYTYTPMHCHPAVVGLETLTVYPVELQHPNKLRITVRYTSSVLEKKSYTLYWAILVWFIYCKLHSILLTDVSQQYVM